MKFTSPFLGVKAGDIYPTEFQPGDECPPELIEAARETGAIETKPAPAAKGKKG